ncbi:MAG: hypothetical protein ED859_13965 [Desulfuromonadales bacterium]|nr:MAG: hypothetical protein ED859_13965 [Desulfuromonadales bacterium]
MGGWGGRLLLLAAWSGTILWFSLDPSPPEPNVELLAWDKFQHAAAYGVLALLWGTFLVAFSEGRHWSWFRAFAAAVGYGALMEVAQVVLTSTRRAEFGDLVADAAGAGIVCLLAATRRTRNRSEGP